jgi:hypothetical protein
MRSSDVKLACSIIEELLTHPISLHFHHKLGSIPLLDASDSIASRLCSGGYASFSDWEAAMHQLWEGPLQSSKEQKNAASALCTLYQKIRRRHCSSRDFADWAANVCRIRDRLDELIHSPPFVGHSEFNFRPMAVNGVRLCSEHDFRQFLHGFSSLARKEDQEQLLKLIEAEQPEISVPAQRVQMNLLALKPSTFAKARDFIREKLRTQDIEYYSL